MFLSGRQAGDSNRQQRLNLVLNGSVKSVKLVAAILWQAAKLRLWHILTGLIVCSIYVHFF